MGEQDYLAADSLQRIMKPEGEDTFRYKLLEAYKTNDVTKQEKYFAALAKDKRGSGYMPTYFSLEGEPDAAERATRLPYNQHLPPAARADRLAALAIYDSWRGRYRSAFAKLREAGRVRPVVDMEMEIAAQPYVQLSRQQLLALRDEVLKTDTTAHDSDDPEVKLQKQLRLYHLALLNCRLGNHEGALSQAQQIEQLSTPPYWAAAVRALASDVRAIVDANTGKSAQALAKFENVKDDPPMDLLNTPANREIGTMWHMELLYRNGRYDDARQWMEIWLPYSFGTGATLPYLLLRRAELADHAGDTKAAAALYAKFIRFMSVGDPEVQPLVMEARDRLAVIQRKVD